MLASLVPDSTTLVPKVPKLRTIPPTKLVPKLTVAWILAPTVVNGGACGGFVTKTKEGLLVRLVAVVVVVVVVVVVLVVVRTVVLEGGGGEEVAGLTEPESSFSPKRLDKKGD
jgi:hypothetical protein